MDWRYRDCLGCTTEGTSEMRLGVVTGGSYVLTECFSVKVA